MGSDLRISIDRQFPNGYWSSLFDGPSNAVERGPAVHVFGQSDEEGDTREYVPREKVREMATHPECPWYRDELPYWVRYISGQEFVRIVRGWAGVNSSEFSPELRAWAALVESLLSEDVPVKVWCWESQ